ncbi:MAG: hypothetical protein SGBAC_006458 [Bacillariaceae sp.]
MNQMAIALLILGPFSATAFSFQPSTQSRPRSIGQSSSSSSKLPARYMSNGLDLGNIGKLSLDDTSSASESNQNNRRRFRPLHLASRISHALASTVPAVHHRIWNNLPIREILSRTAEDQATLKLVAETRKIERQSQNWILRTVVGLNLCPFALKSLKANKVELIVVRGNDANDIGEAVVEQLLIQKESPSGGNSIVVAPDYFPDDFLSYMNMVRYLEEAPMTELDLHGHVQVAPFHPQFVFDFQQLRTTKMTTEDPSSIDNYVNRSPYPMFHILKEHDVDHSVATSCGGDPAKVWRRNAKLLRKLESIMGKEDAVDFLLSFSTQDDMHEYPNEIVSQAMKEIRQDSDGPMEGIVRGVWEI